ncbi:MAG TPA: hypothetical protein PK745_05635 [bacterium]|nr:hypothetical protein [bacterium]
MEDFDYIQEKLNYFFSDGVYRIEVIPKEKPGADAGDSNGEKSSEKHAWESSKNGFTTGNNGSNLR